MVTANAARRLIEHYVDNSRQLPWRSPRGAPPPEPYVVWLSEVMLQQTTVATVKPRFERFVARWPSVQALAAAADEEILSEWAGLGYYARARNLIACAREVVRRGRFPSTAAELRGLPGLGAYTAAAVAAIAFGEAAPAVDTNVARVVSRVQGLRQPDLAEVERYVASLMAEQNPGDVIQALMDLGSAICRPRQPRCELCPLNVDCAARAAGHPEHFPQPRPRKVRPERYGVLWWIERDDGVWLVRRPPKGLLGGMVALPGTDWTDTPAKTGNCVATVRHVFTHFALNLSVELRSSEAGEGWWHPVSALNEAGLPSLYAKAAAAVLKERRSLAA